MGSNFLYPPAKRPLPDPNPLQRNGSSQRLKSSKPPTLSVPPGHVAFRLLCNASRIGGVIGRSGAVIKTLQQSTDAKIRIEDAPPESPDRVILVVAAAALSSKILFRSHRDVRSGDDEVVEVSKAQEALLKVFDRILEVVAEMEGIEFFDRAVSCRLVADKAQAGSVIGKGGMVVEKIRKDTGCIIRVLNDDLPACTSDSDEVIEIEGDVPSVKKALVAVSRRLQDCSPADRTKMMGSKPHEVVQHEALIAMPREASTAVPRETLTAVPHKTFTDWHVDHLPLRSSALSTLSSSSNNYATDRHIDHLQLRSSALSTISSSSNNYADYATDRHVDHLQLRSSALSTLSSSSNNYATGVHSLSAEANRISSLEPKVTQQDVTFRILCSNDRIGGIIGKGGGIVRALQSETGATISIGPSVAECEDRLINITASENPESRYSPAQKAAVLVFSRSIETGIEKGFDSKGTSVTARLVVPSNQVGCLLGKGGVIVSEMRKATGANIRIIGSDQVPKCASDNDQVVQISGAFSSVQDALYNATGRLRDNLFVSTQDSGGTRSLSSIQVDTSPYGRPRDVVPLGGPVVAASHSLNRHSFVQGIDHLSLSRNFDRSSSPSHSLRDVVPLGGSVVAASHSLNIHSFAQGIDHLPLSRNLDQSSSPSHSLRDVVPLGGSVVAASHGLNRHSFAQGIDHLPLSRNLDRSSSPGLWTPPTVASINSRDINDVSWGSSSRKGGLELVSGSKSAIVTNTTVEIVVPDDTIDSVYGENGSNLARLRQISGAKVVIHEPRPGTSDRIIVISGSPDETQAAQSLLQAFILSGSS